MNFKQMRYFVEVADAGGFSKAANILLLAQSALSRHIRLLEEEFGTKLLARTGRGVELTEQGEFLYVRAKEMLDQKRSVEHALSTWHDYPSGPVRLAAPPAVVLASAADIISTLHKKHPAITMNLSENLSKEIGRMLYSGQLDLGIVLGQRPPENLDAELLTFEELCLVTSSDVVLEEPVSIETIAELPLILPTKEGRLSVATERMAAEADVQLNLAFRLDSLQAIKDLIKTGAGVAVLAQSSVRHEVESGQLKTFEIKAKNTKLPVYLAYQVSTPMSRAATATAEVIRQKLKTV